MREQSTRSDSSGEPITAWADGSCLDNGSPDAVAGFACVIESDEQQEPDQPYNSATFEGPTTSNLAEYMGVLLALGWIDSHYSTDQHVHLYTDSELVVYQLRGVYGTNEDHLAEICAETQNLLDEFEGWDITHRSKPDSPNLRRADELAKAAARSDSS